MSIRFVTNEPDDDLVEDVHDESQDEMPDELPRIQPRPPRASLTHHAIKTELMKMNKQKESQRLAELQALEADEDNLSRAARKRKRRRDKVNEERRASG
jgi:hypothetical protein